MGVTHYLTKPWQPGVVESAIKVALREAETMTDKIDDRLDPDVPESEPVVRTGNTQMDRILDRGIPLGSLTLIEGVPSGGKSVLCQHLTYESLQDGHCLAYFTCGSTANDIITQMGSFGLEVSKYFRDGTLGIYPMEEPTEDADPEHCEEPERLMALLAADIKGVHSQYKVIIVDDITKLVIYNDEKAIMRFFASCKSLCEAGRAIILVARSYAFDETMLNRLHVMCDAHLILRDEKIGAKNVKTLEARKVRNTDMNTSNTVSFEVVQGIGLRVVPGAKVRV